MQVVITINCEDADEALSHLAEIRLKIKREKKQQGGRISKSVRLTDNNCYGDHSVDIIPDCKFEGIHFLDEDGQCRSCGEQIEDTENK